MPGESRGTLRAALCACVELISSPCLPLFPPPSSLFRVPECWQRQRRARSPSGPGPAASSRPPTLSSLLSLSPLPSSATLSFSLSCFFLISSRVFLSLAAFLLSFHPLYLPGSPLFAVASPFYVVASLIFPIPAPTNKTLSLPPPVSIFVSLHIFIYVPPVPLLARFILFLPSGAFLLLLLLLFLSFCFSLSLSFHLLLSLILLFVGLSTFYVSRLIFPIQRPLIKLCFASPCGQPRTFWEIAFPWRSHAAAIARFARVAVDDE